MGAVYAIFAGFYYWVGKITGYQAHSVLSQIHFWVFTIAINLVFFPMHALGLAGMPRRMPDYPDGYASWNKIITWGSILTFLSVFIFCSIIYNLFARNNQQNAANYWINSRTTRG